MEDLKIHLYLHTTTSLTRHVHCYRPVARGGGSGGVVRPPPPPPVAHPKDFVPPFSNFVPPFSNFVPPLEYVDDVTRAMSKGGALVNVQEWGRFSN